MIAIVGASGFIGKNLVRHIANAGYDVLPVYFSKPSDFKNEIQFEELLRSDIKIDEVIFCGGNSNHNVSNAGLLHAIEIDSNYIQQYFERFTCTKAILVSSAAVYYGYEGTVDERTCPRPNVNYGLSKRVAEMVFEKEVHYRGCSGVVLRLTHAYGPGERDNRLFKNIARAVTNREILKVHGTGNSYINPVPIEFFDNVVTYLLNKEISSGLVEYYNIGSCENLKVIDIVYELNKYFDFDYAFEGEEEQPVNFMTSVKKLGDLGFKCEDSIRSLIEYIQSIINIDRKNI